MATPSTPTPIEGPVVRSVDIDLDTPAPTRRARAAGRPRAGETWTLEANRALGVTGGTSAASARRGGPVMNRPAMNPSRAPLRMPGQLPSVSSSPMQPFASERPYPIQPTPTFSFTDELDAELRRTQRGRKRSGGGGLLLVLMLLAGCAGYVAVKYRVWQDPGPLVRRAKELAQSLLTLAPSASPEPPRLAPPPAPSLPRLAPEVVPITREPEPASAKRDAAARPQPTPAHHRHVESDSPRRPSEPTLAPSTDDPTEEELLAPPANRR